MVFKRPTFNMLPEFIIAYISFGSVLIPLSIAFAKLNKVWYELKFLCFILLISFVTDLASILVIRYIVGANTYLIGNIYLIVQFILLVLLFRKHLRSTQFADIVLLFFILFSLGNLFFFQGPWVFNSVSNVVACLVLISFCIFYFYRLLTELPTMHILRLPMLWISFAVLTYYGGNFFLFLINNYLIYGDTDSHKVMWILHNLLNIIKNILFAVALWQSYRQTRQFTLSSSAP